MNNPHGEFECDVTGQLLMFSARGPWNDETMRNGVVKMSSDISTFKQGSKWAQLSCLYGESLMPPSTFDIFVKQTRVRKTRGLSFLAVVILDTDVMLTTKHQISQCYDTAEVPFGFYDCVDDALTELKRKGYDFNRDNAVHFFTRFDFTRKK
ncbi:hypothetical protein KUL118_09230 [Tenacibaculum sp. KUL118]|nr:hypothetical protein KUL118_09230 [Tenacibaculum sp. KUL118]